MNIVYSYKIYLRLINAADSNNRPVQALFPTSETNIHDEMRAYAKAKRKMMKKIKKLKQST